MEKSVRWIPLLFFFWINLGVTLQYVTVAKQMEQKVNQLEHLIEQCLKGGKWNLEGFYFLCEANYTGDGPYTIYLK